MWAPIKVETSLEKVILMEAYWCHGVQKIGLS